MSDISLTKRGIYYMNLPLPPFAYDLPPSEPTDPRVWKSTSCEVVSKTNSAHIPSIKKEHKNLGYELQDHTIAHAEIKLEQKLSSCHKDMKKECEEEINKYRNWNISTISMFDTEAKLNYKNFNLQTTKSNRQHYQNSSKAHFFSKVVIKQEQIEEEIYETMQEIIHDIEVLAQKGEFLLGKNVNCNKKDKLEYEYYYNRHINFCRPERENLLVKYKENRDDFQKMEEGSTNQIGIQSDENQKSMKTQGLMQISVPEKNLFLNLKEKEPHVCDTENVKNKLSGPPNSISMQTENKQASEVQKRKFPEIDIEEKKMSQKKIKTSHVLNCPKAEHQNACQKKKKTPCVSNYTETENLETCQKMETTPRILNCTDTENQEIYQKKERTSCIPICTENHKACQKKKMPSSVVLNCNGDENQKTHQNEKRAPCIPNYTETKNHKTCQKKEACVLSCTETENKETCRKMETTQSVRMCTKTENPAKYPEKKIASCVPNCTEIERQKPYEKKKTNVPHCAETKNQKSSQTQKIPSRVLNSTEAENQRTCQKENKTSSVPSYIVTESQKTYKKKNILNCTETENQETRQKKKGTLCVPNCIESENKKMCQTEKTCVPNCTETENQEMYEKMKTMPRDQNRTKNENKKMHQKEKRPPHVPNCTETENREMYQKMKATPRVLNSSKIENQEIYQKKKIKSCVPNCAETGNQKSSSKEKTSPCVLNCTEDGNEKLHQKEKSENKKSCHKTSLFVPNCIEDENRKRHLKEKRTPCVPNCTESENKKSCHEKKTSLYVPNCTESENKKSCHEKKTSLYVPNCTEYQNQKQHQKEKRTPGVPNCTEDENQKPCQKKRTSLCVLNCSEDENQKLHQKEKRSSGAPNCTESENRKSCQKYCTEDENQKRHQKEKKTQCIQNCAESETQKTFKKEKTSQCVLDFTEAGKQKMCEKEKIKECVLNCAETKSQKMCQKKKMLSVPNCSEIENQKPCQKKKTSSCVLNDAEKEIQKTYLNNTKQYDSLQHLKMKTQSNVHLKSQNIKENKLCIATPNSVVNEPKDTARKMQLCTFVRKPVVKLKKCTDNSLKPQNKSALKNKEDVSDSQKDFKKCSPILNVTSENQVLHIKQKENSDNPSKENENNSKEIIGQCPSRNKDRFNNCAKDEHVLPNTARIPVSISLDDIPILTVCRLRKRYSSGKNKKQRVHFDSKHSNLYDKKREKSEIMSTKNVKTSKHETSLIKKKKLETSVTIKIAEINSSKNVQNELRTVAKESTEPNICSDSISHVSTWNNKNSKNLLDDTKPRYFSHKRLNPKVLLTKINVSTERNKEKMVTDFVKKQTFTPTDKGTEKNISCPEPKVKKLDTPLVNDMPNNLCEIDNASTAPTEECKISRVKVKKDIESKESSASKNNGKITVDNDDANEVQTTEVVIEPLSCMQQRVCGEVIDTGQPYFQSNVPEHIESSICKELIAAVSENLGPNIKDSTSCTKSLEAQSIAEQSNQSSTRFSYAKNCKTLSKNSETSVHTNINQKLENVVNETEEPIQCYENEDGSATDFVKSLVEENKPEQKVYKKINDREQPHFPSKAVKHIENTIYDELTTLPEILKPNMNKDDFSTSWTKSFETESIAEPSNQNSTLFPCAKNDKTLSQTLETSADTIVDQILIEEVNKAGKSLQSCENKDNFRIDFVKSLDKKNAPEQKICEEIDDTEQPHFQAKALEHVDSRIGEELTTLLEILMENINKDNFSVTYMKLLELESIAKQLNQNSTGFSCTKNNETLSESLETSAHTNINQKVIDGVNETEEPVQPYENKDFSANTMKSLVKENISKQEVCEEIDTEQPHFLSKTGEHTENSVREELTTLSENLGPNVNNNFGSSFTKSLETETVVEQPKRSSTLFPCANIYKTLSRNVETSAHATVNRTLIDVVNETEEPVQPHDSKDNCGIDFMKLLVKKSTSEQKTYPEINDAEHPHFEPNAVEHFESSTCEKVVTVPEITKYKTFSENFESSTCANITQEPRDVANKIEELVHPRELNDSFSTNHVQLVAKENIPEQSNSVSALFGRTKNSKNVAHGNENQEVIDVVDDDEAEGLTPSYEYEASFCHDLLIKENIPEQSNPTLNSFAYAKNNEIFTYTNKNQEEIIDISENEEPIQSNWSTPNKLHSSSLIESPHLPKSLNFMYEAFLKCTENVSSEDTSSFKNLATLQHIPMNNEIISSSVAQYTNTVDSNVSVNRKETGCDIAKASNYSNSEEYIMTDLVSPSFITETDESKNIERQFKQRKENIKQFKQRKATIKTLKTPSVLPVVNLTADKSYGKNISQQNPCVLTTFKNIRNETPEKSPLLKIRQMLQKNSSVAMSSEKQRVDKFSQLQRGLESTREIADVPSTSTFAYEKSRSDSINNEMTMFSSANTSRSSGCYTQNTHTLPLPQNQTIHSYQNVTHSNAHYIPSFSPSLYYNNQSMRTDMPWHSPSYQAEQMHNPRSSSMVYRPPLSSTVTSGPYSLPYENEVRPPQFASVTSNSFSVPSSMSCQYQTMPSPSSYLFSSTSKDTTTIWRSGQKTRTPRKRGRSRKTK